MSATGNKNALNREIGADGKRDWSYQMNDYKSARAICVLHIHADATTQVPAVC